MILICRYVVLVCVVVLVCGVCTVCVVCTACAVCVCVCVCVCLCLFNMNRHLTWTTGEKNLFDIHFATETQISRGTKDEKLEKCAFAKRISKEISHGPKEGKSLHETHFQHNYRRFCRLDMEVVISLGMFTIAVMACLLSKVFGHSHHKNVRKSLRAENFAPRTCSCWPPFRTMDFAPPQQMRPQNIGISPRSNRRKRTHCEDVGFVS